MSYPISYNLPDSVRFRLSRLQQLFVALFCLCLFVIFALLIAIFVTLLTNKIHPNPQNGSNQQFSVEEIRSTIFANILPERIAHNLREITQKPHQAGTEANKEVAQKLANIWRENGIEDVHFLDYDVLLSYPNWQKPNHVSLLDSSGRVLFKTKGLSADLIGNENSPEASIQWLAYSPAGTVQGEPVYCHFGRVEDFERLEKEFGIKTLKGKIAILRYGGTFRGDMVRHAHERGAAGAIIISDPAEIAKEGEDRVFPSTDWLPPGGVQRGSTLIPGGDPLSPLLPSRKDFHKEKTIDQIKNDPKIVPQIPVLPLGYGDAYKIVRRMRGAAVPKDWQGGMNFTYRVGPGFDERGMQIRVEVNSKLEVRTIQNVIGFIWGSELPDEWVLLGNHYDAWVFGSIDPNSGTAILAEVGKAFAEAVKTKDGWRPKRTLVFCGWDAEEYKLIGSTEFVEEFSNVLAERAIVYLNVDLISSNQTLDVRTVPTIYGPAIDAAKAVRDPVNDNQTVYDNWRKHFPPNTNWLPNNPQMDIPGGSSDHAAFLNFLGIPVMDITYRDITRVEYPLYHSRYELPFVNEHIFDHNNLAVHRAVGQYWAELARLFADSPLLPISASTLAHKLLTDYVEDIRQPILELSAKFPNASLPAKRQFENLLGNVHKFVAQSEEFEANIARGNLGAKERVNGRLRKLERCFVNPSMGMAAGGEKEKRHVLFSLSADDSYQATVMANVHQKISQFVNASNEEERIGIGSALALDLAVVQQCLLCAINTLRLSI